MWAEAHRARWRAPTRRDFVAPTSDNNTDHNQVMAVNRAAAHGELDVFGCCETTLSELLCGMDLLAQSNLGWK
jgi:hypothetical protein